VGLTAMFTSPKLD